MILWTFKEISKDLMEFLKILWGLDLVNSRLEILRESSELLGDSREFSGFFYESVLHF